MITSRAMPAASRALLPLLFGSLLAACGGSNDGGGDLIGDDSGDDGGGLVLDGGDDGGGVLPIDALGDPDGRIDPDSACAAESYDAKRIPPNLYVLFDHSGSMTEKVTGGTKWTGSIAALTALATKSTDDLKMGLKFFPPIGAADKTCTPAAFATPDVAVAPLSTSRKPIECWLGTASGCPGITAATPNGQTPMAVALDQAITYMKTVYSGDGTRVVVLLTDGDPNGCGDIAAVIAAATKAPAAPDPKVLVYVIGAPGGTVTNLSQVAAAGGGKRTPTCVAKTTDPTLACHYQIGASSFEADLTAALEDIKGKALTCTFTIPPPSGDAGTIDKTKVNVDETIGGVTSTLPQDPTHTSGWDYTDGGTTITVYGPECDKLKADPTVNIQIVFGCKTKGPS